jgi:alpha-tubulin suppressor-like RCC1 family protein
MLSSTGGISAQGTPKPADSTSTEQVSAPLSVLNAFNADNVDVPVDNKIKDRDLAASPEITKLVAGGSHTCALDSSGGVKCWGNNNIGQLGDGTTIARYTPVEVSGLNSGVIALAAGARHTCALDKDGGVKCWGKNNYGQLGDGTTNDRYMPVEVIGLSSGVTALATGVDYTCALTSEGGIKCWGWNGYGQLGDGTTDDHYTPVDVSGLTSGVIGLTTGWIHTCALTSSGGLKCWGWNNHGQLGDNTTEYKHTPVDVIGLTRESKSIVAGGNYTCSIIIGGEVYCWGHNYYGQLGDGTTTDKLTPVAVSGLSSGVQALTAGWHHTCAITSNGGVMCWGRNENGQLGDGSVTDRLMPVDVIGLSSSMVILDVGAYYTCGLTSTGSVKCWGSNESGQLGDGTTADRHTPVDVVWEAPTQQASNVYLPLAMSNAIHVKPVVPPTTKVLPKDTLQDLAEISEDGTEFTFSETSPELESLALGEIMVGDTSDAAPYGFLRKVSDISNQNGQVVVETVDATLEEAIEQGALKVSKALTPNDVVESQTREGVSLEMDPQSQDLNGFYISIKNIVLYDKDGNTATTGDQVTANGKVEIDPSFDLKMVIKRKKLQELVIINETRETSELKIKFEVSEPLIDEWWILSRHVFAPITVLVGPVPVVIVPILTVSVGVDGSVRAGITTGVTQEANLRAGLIYENGQWSPVSELTNQFTYQAPDAYFEITVKGYTAADLDVMIYGVAGPFARAEAYLKLRYRRDLTSNCRMLDGGLEAPVGVRIKIFSKTIAGYEAKVLDYVWPLYDSCAVTETPVPTPTQTSTYTPKPDLPTRTPTPTLTRTPTQIASEYFTFYIVCVVRDESVTIKTNNLPANQIFNVLMGLMGTKGIDGILVGMINSKSGGSFEATYNIPDELKGESQIAIRLESISSGAYAYNWFYNSTSLCD